MKREKIITTVAYLFCLGSQDLLSYWLALCPYLVLETNQAYSMRPGPDSKNLGGFYSTIILVGDPNSNQLHHFASDYSTNWKLSTVCCRSRAPSKSITF